MKLRASKYTPRRQKRRVKRLAFGEWLKDARGELPQAVLAERAGVSRGYITSVEHNKRVPSIDVAIALAKVLGRGPEEALKALAGEKKLAPSKAPKKIAGQDELVEYYQGMAPKIRKLALEIIKRLAQGEELKTGKYGK
jgi:transcriptional regulator with XRE-family HTH domain